MSYEPYVPGGRSHDPDVSAPSGPPSYDAYQPGGSTYRSAVGSSHQPNRASRSGGTGGGGLLALRVVAAVVSGIAAIVGATHADSPSPAPAQPYRSDYSSCAAAHDELTSDYSDFSWCTDGPGAGVGADPYAPDPYGFDTDPYGFDTDPYGFDDSTYP